MNRFTEYLVEYDRELNMVYVSGLTADNFWEELSVIEDASDSESFAEGWADGLRSSGHFVTVSPVVFED